MRGTGVLKSDCTGISLFFGASGIAEATSTNQNKSPTDRSESDQRVTCEPEKGPPCTDQTGRLQAQLLVADALNCCEVPEDVPNLAKCTALTVETTPTWFADREDSDQEAKEQSVRPASGCQEMVWP